MKFTFYPALCTTERSLEAGLSASSLHDLLIKITEAFSFQFAIENLGLSCTGYHSEFKILAFTVFTSRIGNLEFFEPLFIGDIFEE